MMGSGKTSLAFLHLQHTPAAARFIFDDTGQASARLKRPLAGTLAQLNAALKTRWVLFNPHILFPGELDKGFRFFCRYVMAAAEQGPGKKIFLADEIWRFCDRKGIPKELATIAQMGRAYGVELVTATQRPHLLNDAITGSATEIVCFRLQESIHLRKIQTMDCDAAAVAALPLGSFISFNPLTGSQQRGRLF